MYLDISYLRFKKKSIKIERSRTEPEQYSVVDSNTYAVNISIGILMTIHDGRPRPNTISNLDNFSSYSGSVFHTRITTILNCYTFCTS